MTAIDPSLDLGQSPGAAWPQGRRDRAMLAHDIRSALNGVIGGIGELEASDLPLGLREQVERVATAGRSLASLTAIMLGDAPGPGDWAGGENVSLPAFLRYVRMRWAGEARGKGLGFELAAAPDLPSALRMDHLPLARALGNLISNAVKHSERGCVRIVVVRELSGGIAFVVTDEGPGLPEEVLRRVLASDLPPGRGGGHGLGLHIAREIAAELGGELAISNRSPRGAEAVLRLPAALCAEPEPEDDAPPPVPADRPDLAGMHILLAEDNPTNQMVATQMLQALNARVTLCSDGVEALERFEEEPFNMVVVDIEMPRLSGLDVIRAIRARQDARAHVAIVALTAYALREHRDRVLEAGANGLISKPITSIDALGRSLAAHVGPPQPAPPALALVPAEVPAAGPGPVVDREIYDALVEAIGPEMMAELLEKVVADLLKARDDLAGALDPLDRAPIRAASHILISVAGAIGATQLQSCARSLNAAAHGAEDAGIAEQVRRCIEAIEAAAAFARDQRGTG